MTAFLIYVAEADLDLFRTVCCHPQVGRGARLATGDVLKTVEDVLQSMKEKAVSAVLSDTRALFATRVKRGQLMCYDKEDCERFETALDIFRLVLLEVEPVVEDVVQKIKEVWAARKEWKRSA